MQTNISVFPRRGDTPAGILSPATSWPHGIPVLGLVGAYDYPCIQFDPADYDDAVRYLDELADAASGLAAKIRLAQAAAEVEPETTPAVTS